MMQTEYRQGLWYALGCYLIWGLFPIYWLPLNHAAVPAEQILAHRIVWSAVFSVALVWLFGQQRGLIAAFRQPKILGVFALSSVLIAMNWLIYLWAIGHQHILDASLGYFINPLFNVLLGCLLFHEQMNRTQMVAIALAMMGVVWLAMLGGHIPWVALGLAGSFGLYAAIRKRAPMDALTGLTLETLLLLPCALIYLGWSRAQGHLVFSELNGLQMAVLLGAGVATSLPLLCFAASAKRIPMSHLGILQYLSPTLQMACGLWLFHEPLDGNRLLGYIWVWLGVAVFLYGIWQQVSRKTAVS